MELAVVVTGALIAALIVVLLRRTSVSSFSDEQFTQLAERVRHELAESQAEALRQNSTQFLELAETRLKAETARGEEQLRARGTEIEKGLESVGGALSRLREYVELTDKTRGESLATLSAVVGESRKATEALGATTGRLTEILASSQTRGQWGERMADDILHAAGFEEGVQYQKNKQLDGGTGRPDFTFLLPQGRTLHMDVKFPLAAYVRFLEGDSEAARASARQDFIRDARSRIKEVTTRDYINLESDTLDYVLLFVPNEQVYGFMHESAPTLLDDALAERVVMCSPFTLFAVLSVIRQAIDNFHLTQRTDEILRALSGFNQQWVKYKDATEAVGRRIDSTQRAFALLEGRRTRVLDRQLQRVEQLRKDAGLEILLLPEPEDDVLDTDEDLPEFDKPNRQGISRGESGVAGLRI